MTRDFRLSDAVAELPVQQWSGYVYRTCWQGRDVLQGSSGGGRWSARNGFEILYTSQEKNGAIAEIDAWLREMSPRPDQPIEVHKIEIETQKTVVIEDLEVLANLDVDISRYSERIYDRTQQIGDAVNFLGNDGLIAPSARWDCMNLILFLGNNIGDNKLMSVESEIVDWDRWIDTHSS